MTEKDNLIKKVYKTVLYYQCKRCGHLWRPRKENPVQCPKCKSLLWRNDL